ncbi:DEKNAAC101520 [Brettanomyces naardenensis]|uniref:DEKNAAC101520 n=1 Tax=Brettanomyces naardenensis TaxID=13370 RepID=A0A448YI98_BRENA|nr:DEKNAAC101520 [Brettanomyces naardenensis]
MIPGDGYDSEDPDREDDPLIEEGIVLRMLPNESLDTLRACVESGDMNGISLKWKDKKRAVLRINGVLYGGKLVNLPTIVEVHKSIDKKNIYKSMDLSQILLIVRKLNSEDDINEINVDNEYGETHPDGLTPPMENSKVRFKRRYEEQVIQNVEDEVDRLLKLDEEAESTNYEFIDSSMLNNPRALNSLRKGRKRRKAKKGKGEKEETEKVEKEVEQQAEEDLDNELDKLIGEEEEEEVEGELVTATLGDGMTKARVEEDEGEGEEVVEGAGGDEGEEEEEEEGEEEEGDEEEEEEDEEEEEEEEEEQAQGETSTKHRAFVKGEMDESKQHNAILREEISELESTIEQKQRDLNKANNPIMRNRINDVISRLQQELDMKKGQMEPEEEKEESEEAEEGEEPANEEEKDGTDEEEEDLEGLF